MTASAGVRNEVFRKNQWSCVISAALLNDTARIEDLSSSEIRKSFFLNLGIIFVRIHNTMYDSTAVLAQSANSKGDWLVVKATGRDRKAADDPRFDPQIGN